MKKEKKLQEAYSRKERAENLLSNLENLKQEGTVDESQYESMKSEYSEMLNNANSEVDQIKGEINKGLESAQKDLDAYKQELSNLEARFKVGEFSSEDYRKSERKIQDKIEKTQSKISELNRLLESKGSEDVGGAVDVSKGKKGKSVDVAGATEKIPAIEELTTTVRDTSTSDFTSFVSTFGEVTTPRIKLIGLLGGILMLISVFVPWASISAFGVSATASAFALNGGLGWVGLVAGLICVFAAFLELSNARGILHVGMGILALLALLVVWASSPNISVAQGSLDVMREKLMEMITIREGFYLYIISFIAVIVGGLFELKEK